MLTVCTAAPTGARAAADRPQIEDVRQAVEQLAEHPGVLGVIAEAYYDGERIDRGTAGSRLINGEGGAIPTGSGYRAWSQTKPMTATVLLQLVDEGKLGVDDKLSDVLPIVADRDLVELADQITVRQLLQHTSGVPDYGGQLDGFDLTYLSPKELVRVSRGLRREQEPGEKFSYSNTNYVLLGMVIERVTGNRLADEFDRRLFDPLRMDRTYLPTKPTQGIKGPHGHGYYPDDRGRLRDTDKLNATNPWAAGGVISTAEDLTGFYRAYQRGELLPAHLQEIIGPRPAPPGTPPRCAHGVIGGGPGSVSVTSTTPDGRLQLAVSVTLVGDVLQIGQAITEASEQVLCPTR